jgi:hypothetical protein
MMRTKKTKRTSTGTKNRRSSENPTNSPHASRLLPRGSRGLDICAVMNYGFRQLTFP